MSKTLEPITRDQHFYAAIHDDTGWHGARVRRAAAGLAIREGGVTHGAEACY